MEENWIKGKLWKYFRMTKSGSEKVNSSLKWYLINLVPDEYTYIGNKRMASEKPV